MFILIFILLPFLQWGLSYWVSIAVLSLGIGILPYLKYSFLHFNFFLNLFRPRNLPVLALAAVIIVRTPVFAQSVLYPLRLAFFLVLQISILEFIRIPSLINYFRKTSFIFIFPIASSLWTALVTSPAFLPISSIRSQYILLQDRFVITNKMFDSLDKGFLQFIDYVKRPLSTFGEPSYYALVLTINTTLLIFCLMSSIHHSSFLSSIAHQPSSRTILLSRKVRPLILISIIINICLILINRSFLGFAYLAFLFFLLSLNFIISMFAKKSVLSLPYLIVCVLIALVLLNSSVFSTHLLGDMISRVTAIIAGDDLAAAGRIYVDFNDLSILGLGLSFSSSQIAQYDLHNSFLSGLFIYGVFYLAYLVRLIDSVFTGSPNLYPFLLCSFQIICLQMQNDDIFTPDKTLLLLLLMQFYYLYFYSFNTQPRSSTDFDQYSNMSESTVIASRSRP